MKAILPLCSGRSIVFIGCLLLCNIAQAFQLQSMDASRVNLMDYMGDDSWTVVMFWATDCIPCEEQKPALEAFYQKHKNGIAKVVGVVIDGMESKSEIDVIMSHHAPTYPNLVAFNDVFHRQYNELVGRPFRTTPTFLVFDPTGTLQGNLYGYIDFEALSQHVSQQVSSN